MKLKRLLQPRRMADNAVTYLLLLAVSALFLFPCLWLILASFSKSGDIYSFSGFFPTEYSANTFIDLFTNDVYVGAIDTLADIVKAEENSNLEGVRPKFIRKVVEALTGLGLDIDTASEFIARKQEGTPFEGDGDVHDAILLEMGFELPAKAVEPYSMLNED